MNNSYFLKEFICCMSYIDVCANKNFIRKTFCLMSLYYYWSLMLKVNAQIIHCKCSILICAPFFWVHNQNFVTFISYVENRLRNKYILQMQPKHFNRDRLSILSLNPNLLFHRKQRSLKLFPSLVTVKKTKTNIHPN